MQNPKICSFELFFRRLRYGLGHPDLGMAVGRCKLEWRRSQTLIMAKNFNGSVAVAETCLSCIRRRHFLTKLLFNSGRCHEMARTPAGGLGVSTTFLKIISASIR